MEKEKSHFSLTWDKYHTSMCAGFSLLQQKGEMVDLTLAADGHLVKVHQIILGIASPYLKELIQSANCKHPVIFMNNVSYTVLRSILEYIYTGEVSVAEENLNNFFETAKTLQIKGLANTSPPQLSGKKDVKSLAQSEPSTNVDNTKKEKDYRNVVVKYPADSKYNQLKRKSTSSCSIVEPTKKIAISSVTPKESTREDDNESDGEDDSHDGGDDGHDGGGDDVNVAGDFELSGLVENTKTSGGGDSQGIVPPAELQYTVSNRGALQLILNRYLYNLISKSTGGSKKWRCVEYRDHRCPAAAVTNKNVVVRRTNLHNHPFHDKRILMKIKKKAVYSALRTADDQLEATDT